MSSEPNDPAPEADLSGGWLAWFTKNSVASNLLMIMLFVGGFVGLFRVKQEVFPEFSLDTVQISVPYPGASPEEVEQGITLAVEEGVRGLDGVKRVTSTSSEGRGSVTVELLLGVNGDKVLADVKSAVDRITSFPEDAEEPTVSLLEPKRQVLSLVISGDQDLARLQDIAEDARRRMLAHPDVTQVEIFGVPPLEVQVEVPRENLEAYGLTAEQIAGVIRGASLELPGGGIETDSGEILVRVADRARSLEEFQQIIVRGTRDGGVVRLGDIATLTDGYQDTKQATFYDGVPAVQITAYRVGNESPISVSDAVHEVMAELRAELPANIALDIWDDDSELLEQRIDLLVRNAISGFILVLIVLALLLDLRLAFWVALGIPISFMGAFFLMPSLDVSINMISLFALIVTLGMVVDDAIIVGEAAYEKMERGLEPLRAAIAGAQEMTIPVTFAILTTIAAFSPMFFVPGVSGKIFRILPLMVLAVLLFSLIESFLVLPNHLGHGSNPVAAKTGLWAYLDAPRAFVSGQLDRFIQGPYRSAVEAMIRFRYVAVSSALALFILSVGVVASGWLPFSFFPVLEGNVITATARLPYGAPIDRTLAVRDALERSAQAALVELDATDDKIGLFTKVGQGPAAGGPNPAAAPVGSHLVTLQMELVGAEERDYTAEAFADVWRANTPELAGLEALKFSVAIGPSAGAAVDLQLVHPDADVLALASEELTDTLRGYAELINVENGFAAGKPQLDFTLKPAATTLGLTSADIARQIRGAFFGAEALREQRGRNEVRVMVRLPEDQRASEADLDRLLIRTPAGGMVPLYNVVALERGRSPTSIKREDGVRVVNVVADKLPSIKSVAPVLEDINDQVVPALEEKYPGLSIGAVGQQRSQNESFASLGTNFIVAIFAIYALLAIPFRSWVQPFIVMSAIPFGFIGAVGGHLLMGFELSIISFFGIVALAGVVVNDSLVLVDAANRYREREQSTAIEAIRYGGMRRLRPILLTSLTTFFGLAPMIFETSIQARFLIPMAISLGFGILFATVIILMVVPALYMIVEDGIWAWNWYWDLGEFAPDASDDEADDGPPDLEGQPAK